MPITGVVQRNPVIVTGEVDGQSALSGSVVTGSVASAGAVTPRVSLSGLVLTALGEGGVSDGLINVKDSPYNAVGDSTTNDTAAVLAALAAAEADDQKTPVYFPPGIYRLTTALTPFDGMRLIAAGRGSEFGYGAKILNLTTDMFTPTADVNDIHIEGIQFEGHTGTKVTDWWTVNTGFQIEYSQITKCGFTGFKRIYWGSWTGVWFDSFYVNGSDTQIQQFKLAGSDNSFGPGFIGSSGFNRTTLTVAAPAHATPNDITVADATGAFVGAPVYIGNVADGSSATRDVTSVSAINGNVLTVGTLSNSHQIGEYVHIVMTHACVESTLSHSKIDRLYISPGPGMAMHVLGGHSSVFINLELSGSPAISAGPGLYVSGAVGHQFIGMVLSKVGFKAYNQYNGALVIADSTDLNITGTLMDNIVSSAPNLIRLSRSGAGGALLTDDITISGTTYNTVTGSAVKLSGNAAMVTAAGLGARVDFDEYPIIKTGAPADSDFYSLARDGLTITDTSNSRFYTRVGGSWKYAALT